MTQIKGSWLVTVLCLNNSLFLSLLPNFMTKIRTNEVLHFTIQCKVCKQRKQNMYCGSAFAVFSVAGPRTAKLTAQSLNVFKFVSNTLKKVFRFPDYFLVAVHKFVKRSVRVVAKIRWEGVVFLIYKTNLLTEIMTVY